MCAQHMVSPLDAELEDVADCWIRRLFRPHSWRCHLEDRGQLFGMLPGIKWGKHTVECPSHCFFRLVLECEELGWENGPQRHRNETA